MSDQLNNTGTAIEVAAPPAAPLARSALMPTQSEMATMVQISNAIAKSGMSLPKDCRTPEAVFAKVLLGWEHGIGPMSAVNSIYNIEGKASLPEEMKVAIIRARKLGDVRTAVVTDQAASVIVTRPDILAPVEIVFTVDDAVRGGLLRRLPSGELDSSKDNWRKWRKSMLLARARAVACHQYFEEVFTGLPYSPDELGATTDEQGRLIDVPAFEPVQHPWQQSPASATDGPAASIPSAAVNPAPAAEQPPLSVPNVPAPPPAQAASAPAGGPSARQLDQLAGLKAALRLDTEPWRLQCRMVAGVESARLMTAGQAGKLADRLDNLRVVRLLRQAGVVASLTPEQWEKALAKRHVTRDLDLADADLQEIRDKLLDLVTPFDRQKLGLEAAPAGVPAGNVSPPSPPWPRGPLSEAA